jgi:hypothetical protein
MFRIISRTNSDNFKGQDFLTLEDGTDRLSRNVRTELPLYVMQYARGAQISSTSRQKPESRMFTIISTQK